MLRVDCSSQHHHLVCVCLMQQSGATVWCNLQFQELQWPYNSSSLSIYYNSFLGGSVTQYLTLTASELSTSILGPENQCLADTSQAVNAASKMLPTAVEV